MVDDNDFRTLFEIPEDNFDKFMSEIKKINNRAKKMGIKPIEPFVFQRSLQKMDDGFDHYILTVLMDEVAPKIDHWTFVARLDHSNETGNIIRMVPNVEPIPELYRTCAPNCDHCKHNRYRRDTFVLRHDDGHYMQVGSTCLEAFFGLDPRKYAKMAELLGYAYEIGKGHEQFVGGDRRWMNVEDYLTFCAHSVRVYGWVSGSDAFRDVSLTSTRQLALDNMFDKKRNPNDYPTDKDRAFAIEALDWARDITNPRNDYEHNISVIAGSQMMEFRSLGLAASIVGVYLKRKNDELNAKNDTKASVYIGNVKDKVEFPVTVIFSKPIETDYGYSYLYNFVTEDHNVLTWFSSTNKGFDVGQKFTLRGTVKGHKEFNGVKQTVLTRCKKV